MSIDRVFIVGLPDRFRGAELEAALERAGIDSLRSDGVLVDPERMDRSGEFDPVSARLLMHRPMSASELGCALAHQRVYEQILGDRLDAAIVFEDDARLLRIPDLDALAALLAVAHARVIALHAPRGYAIVDDTRPHGRAALAYPAVVPPVTTTAYALNRAAAEVLAHSGRPVTHVADWPVGAEVHCEFLVLREPLAAPDESAGSQVERPVGDVGRGARLSARLRRVLHVDWFRHRRLYGDHPTYLMHELIRQPVYAWAARQVASAESALIPAPWFIRWFAATAVHPTRAAVEP